MLWLLLVLILCIGCGLYLWADRRIGAVHDVTVLLTDSLRETQAALKQQRELHEARLDASDGHLTDLHSQLHDVGQVITHRSRTRVSSSADQPRVPVIFRKGMLTIDEKRMFGWSLRSELIWKGGRYRFSTRDGNDYIYLYMGEGT